MSSPEESLASVEPGLAGFLAASPASAAHVLASPSAARALGREPLRPDRVPTGPVFLNVEATTRCNMACPACARTRRGTRPRDMDRARFRNLLDRFPHAYRVTLVGLGEPLLHPEVCGLVADAAARKRKVSLVTNAALLDRAMGRGLLEAGISGVTFSLDAATAEDAARLRPGAALERVLGNIRGFVAQAGAWAAAGGRRPELAVFSAVSRRTAPALPGLIELVSGLGVSALMLSDLNFAENFPDSLAAEAAPASAETRAALRRAVSRGIAGGLPIFSVHGLEGFGLEARYRDFLLLPPGLLWRRPRRRTHCDSPWQTLPVSVDGRASVCDCLPERLLGSVCDDPPDAAWNAPEMVEHRRRMNGDDPPAACRTCPRF